MLIKLKSGAWLNLACVREAYPITVDGGLEIHWAGSNHPTIVEAADCPAVIAALAEQEPQPADPAELDSRRRRRIRVDDRLAEVEALARRVVGCPLANLTARIGQLRDALAGLDLDRMAVPPT